MSKTKKFLVALQKSLGGQPKALHDAIEDLIKEIELEERPTSPPKDQQQQQQQQQQPS